MKKILVTRRLLRSCEDKAETNFKAILNSNEESVIELIRAWSDIEQKNGDNKSPLYLATEKYNVNIVRALVEKGARTQEVLETFNFSLANNNGVINEMKNILTGVPPRYNNTLPPPAPSRPPPYRRQAPPDYEPSPEEQGVFNFKEENRLIERQQKRGKKSKQKSKSKSRKR